MHAAPLVGHPHHDDVLAWQDGTAITRSQFLSHVVGLAASLPSHATVINLSEHRYRFLVGFAAALLRGQITLLPPDRSPRAVTQLAQNYPDSYCLTDGAEAVDGLACHHMRIDDLPTAMPLDAPRIPLDQKAVVAFTSGSTGQPRPNVKTWEALIAVATHTAARLGLKASDRMHVVVTVPHQHMYGLEASIMLPLVHGWTFHSGRPLFPEDVRAALAAVPDRRILVTTPLHIRACVMAQLPLPTIEIMLSATAPLTPAMARQAELAFNTQVHEIYGFAEAGSVAMRRTVTDTQWQVLDGISLHPSAGGCCLRASYLKEVVAFPDVVTPEGPYKFQLHGRGTDLVNIGGHRASLSDLNQTLNGIEGVEDGVFFLSDDRDEVNARIVAFVVAPHSSVEQILRELRASVDPVFLPRPLSLVPSLPRNATGKLTRESLMGLVQQYCPRNDNDR
jgi:acyl-coenzyme A synthetase/AMP-(fatty) acid ligase